MMKEVLKLSTCISIISKIGKSFWFLPFLFFLSFRSVLAQPVINEFSVDPPDDYDWVELYSPEEIDISGWKLGDETGVFKTFEDGTRLGPEIYLVIEKYRRLNNDKDTIFLYNPAGEVVDKIKYGYEGEVCLPSSDGSIARLPDGGNTYDRVRVHTKGIKNDSSYIDPCPTPPPVVSETPSPSFFVPSLSPRPSPSLLTSVQKTQTHSLLPSSLTLEKEGTQQASLQVLGVNLSGTEGSKLEVFDFTSFEPTPSGNGVEGLSLSNRIRIILPLFLVFVGIILIGVSIIWARKVRLKDEKEK